MKHFIFNLFFTMIFIMLLVSSVYAKEKLAIMNLKPVGVDKILAEAVSENLKTMIIQTNEFEVIERSQLASILKEYELVQSGITDDKTAMKFGELANVDLVMIGSINKMFNTYTLNVRVLHIESGSISFAKKVKIDSEADFPDMIDELALNIADEKKKMVLKTEEHNIVGRYSVKGLNYKGIMKINKYNEVYLISWTIDNSGDGDIDQTLEGVGILDNKMLSVYFQDNENKEKISVALYDILLDGTQIRGIYTEFKNSGEFGSLAFEHGEKIK